MYTKKIQGWIKHIDFFLLDMLSLQLSFVLAYWTRHGVHNIYSNSIYLSLAFVLLLVDFFVNIVNQTLEDVLKRGYFKEAAQTVWHAFLVMLIVSLYMFSVQLGEDYSRIAFYLTFVYYVVLTYCVRIIWKHFVSHKSEKNLYLLTTKAHAPELLSELRKNDFSCDEVQGMCILDENCVGQIIAGVSVTSYRDNVLSYLCDKWVDEVFVSLPQGYPYPSDIITSLTEMGIVVHIEMEHLDVGEGQHQIIQSMAGTTVCTISMNVATPLQVMFKRAVDIVGALFGCILTVLLTLIIGPMIYIKSPGPVFFSQTRVGQNGRKFKLYKFRSMYLDAEEHKAELMTQNRVQGGLMFKLEYDPRIIGCEKRPDGTVKKGIGNFIRDYSLDEFPQFFNVLKGDLSLCGTRPPTVDEWEQYEPHHRARLAIKPGITGLWQVSGRSNITDFEQVVELDKKYIREWSMGLDFRILLQTVKVVFHKDGSM